MESVQSSYSGRLVNGLLELGNIKYFFAYTAVFVRIRCDSTTAGRDCTTLGNELDSRLSVRESQHPEPHFWPDGNQLCCVRRVGLH
jgi:hypothetical protein